MRKTLCVVFIAIAAFTKALQASPICPDFSGAADLQSNFSKEFNAFRSSLGLGNLSVSLRLSDVASDYACLLASTGHFDHTGPDGSDMASRVRAGGYAFCSIAENLAKGQATVDRVMLDWRNSPGHYKNLVRDSVNEFGLGIAIAGQPERAINSLTDLAREAQREKTAEKLGGSASGALVWVLLVGREC